MNTETVDEKDELIARLATDNANLQRQVKELNDLTNELEDENTELQEHKQCCNEWLDKTAWAQNVPWATRYFGLHRADGMRQRIEALEGENANLQAELGRQAVRLGELDAQEPVGIVKAKSDRYGGVFVLWKKQPIAGMLLYTYPQITEVEDENAGSIYSAGDALQPERRPLTEDALIAAYHTVSHDHLFVSAFIAGVRYAESEHGIKEAT